jgi:catechol 2,3-dioxygenase-like lactoylglutathione lyase family enzyme
MTILLDHVSHWVNDRDAAADTLRGLGLNATSGGQHIGFGSANHLCYFDLFYIEMLAIENAAEALASGSGICRQAVSFLEQGEGFGNIAFETETLDEDVAAMRAHGLQVDDPIRMERVQPDGFISVSRIVYPASATPTAIPLPILIERSIRPAERAPMLRAKGVIADHAAGVMTVDHVALCTSDLEAALDLLRRFGLDGTVTRYEDTALNATCLRVETDRGGVVLCTPTGPGPVKDALALHGAGPFLIGIAAQDGAAAAARLGTDARGFLAPAMMHGALLRLL